MGDRRVLLGDYGDDVWAEAGPLPHDDFMLRYLRLGERLRERERFFALNTTLAFFTIHDGLVWQITKYLPDLLSASV